MHKRILATVLSSIMLTGTVYADDNKLLQDNMIDTYNNWSDEYKSYCHVICEQYGVSEGLVLGIIWNESRFKGESVGENENV